MATIMKTIKRTVGGWLPLLVAVLIVAPGCEKDSTNDDVQAYLDANEITPKDRLPDGNLRITPETATGTQIGQQLSFKATGGEPPYRWRVSDGANGNVQVDGWSEAIYTVRRIGGNDVIVTDKKGHAAIARIGGTINLTASVIPIDRDGRTILPNDGDKAVLTATGGSPPYQWIVIDPALGHIIGIDTGNSVGYMREHNGDNVVRVRDADGSVVNVRIEQP